VLQRDRHCPESSSRYFVRGPRPEDSEWHPRSLLNKAPPSVRGTEQTVGKRTEAVVSAHLAQHI
jgi:hypothetical protein